MDSRGEDAHLRDPPASAAAPSVSSAFVPFALPSARRTSKKENFSVGLLSFYQIFIKYNLFLIA